MKIHWLEQTEAEVPPEDDWLSPTEAVRCKAMRVAKRRTDWRLGRWTAKCAVSAYLNAPAALEAFREMEIRQAADGAPEAYLNGFPAAVTISLSHSSGVAMCAVAPPDIDLGCDVEWIERRSPAFIVDYFTAEEQERIARANEEERDQLVTLLWSAKESALKALRAGLRLDTRSVVVDAIVNPLSPPFAGAQWRPLSVHYVGYRLPEHVLLNNHRPEKLLAEDFCDEGRCPGDISFEGWWQHKNNVVRTLVAAPKPEPPILLHVPEHVVVRPVNTNQRFRERPRIGA